MGLGNTNIFWTDQLRKDILGTIFLLARKSYGQWFVCLLNLNLPTIMGQSVMGFHSIYANVRKILRALRNSAVICI